MSIYIIIIIIINLNIYYYYIYFNSHVYGPAHPGLSCQEQIELMLKEKEVATKYKEWQNLNSKAQQLFDAYVKLEGNIKPCPNCKAVIVRSEGCDHMTCRVCKCNFCYICGKYDKKNYLNRGDCGVRCQNKA